MKLHLPHRTICIAGALTAFAWSTLAQAQTTAIPTGALNRYEPSERGSEWFANESLDFRTSWRPTFGMTADYAHAPYTLVNPDGSVNTRVIENTMYAHLGASIILFDRLRIGVSLPLAIAQQGHDKTVNGQVYLAPTEGGIGDLRVGVELLLLGAYGSPIALAIGARVWAPTGNTQQYIGDGKARIGPRVSVAGDFSMFTYAASVGFVYRANDTPFNGHATGTELTFNAAFGVRLAEKKVVLGAEVFGSTAGDAAFATRSTPLALLFGGHLTAGPLLVGLGAGPGLSLTAGTPDFRGLLSLDYVPFVDDTPAPSDRDDDCVLNRDDACPDLVGIQTADPKTNGCPADRDGDGIYDKDDACPMVPGVRTNDLKTNGCPADRDGDGIPDNVDACPDVVGQRTADPKTNGCPSDRDSDGVYDYEDACPIVAGQRTTDPKTNGCPADRDGDGVSDVEDACPEIVGRRTNNPMTNGCPLVFIKGDEVKITEQIQFSFDSSTIIASQHIIDEVASILRAHPEIKHVRVQGHTDDAGTREYNKLLSSRRATAVLDALVKAGVAKERLSSQGYGKDNPVVTNGTQDGRTENRRVEFHIDNTAGH